MGNKKRVAVAKDTRLHHASRAGNLEEVTTLLDGGADVTAQDQLQRNPLHLAAFAGQAVRVAD